jgi:hypothetical protein
MVQEEKDIFDEDIVIMADHSSSGIWIKSNEYVAGGGMVDYGEFGLPSSLKREFKHWAYNYEGMWNRDYLRLDEERLPKFNVWGLSLATRFKDYTGIKKVWYCPVEGNDKMVKESLKLHCVVVGKFSNIVLGVSLISNIVPIGVDHTCYYPVAGDITKVGTKFCPKKAKECNGFRAYINDPEGRYIEVDE